MKKVQILLIVCATAVIEACSTNMGLLLVKDIMRNYKRNSIVQYGVFLLCSFLVCILVIKLTIQIYRHKKFSWFIGYDIFFYFLLHVVIMVSVFSSKFSYYYVHVGLCGFSIVMQFGFTMCISQYYRQYQDNIRLQEEKRLEMMHFVRKDGVLVKSPCQRIPLTGSLPSTSKA